MKFISRLFPLMLLVSLFVVSCSQDENETAVEQIPTPIEFITDAPIVNLDSYVATLNINDIVSDQVANRTDCPAYEHAKNELAKLNAYCTYSKEYCAYLKLFYRIHAAIAAIQCGLPGWCGLCDQIVAQADEDLRALRESGIHPSYVNNIGEQIWTLANLCLDCDGE